MTTRFLFSNDPKILISYRSHQLWFVWIHQRHYTAVFRCPQCKRLGPCQCFQWSMDPGFDGSKGLWLRGSMFPRIKGQIWIQDWTNSTTNILLKISDEPLCKSNHTHSQTEAKNVNVNQSQFNFFHLSIDSNNSMNKSLFGTVK